MLDFKKDSRCNQCATARGKWKEQPTCDWTLHVYIIRCSKLCACVVCVRACVYTSHRPCTGLPKSPKLPLKVTICVCVFFNTSENKTKQKVFPVLLLCGIEIKLVFAPSIKEVGKKSIVHSCFHYSFFTIYEYVSQSEWVLCPMRHIFWRDDTYLNKRNNSNNGDTMNIKKKLTMSHIRRLGLRGQNDSSKHRKFCIL